MICFGHQQKADHQHDVSIKIYEDDKVEFNAVPSAKPPRDEHTPHLTSPAA